MSKLTEQVAQFSARHSNCFLCVMCWMKKLPFAPATEQQPIDRRFLKFARARSTDSRFRLRWLNNIRRATALSLSWCFLNHLEKKSAGDRISRKQHQRQLVLCCVLLVEQRVVLRNCFSLFATTTTKHLSAIKIYICCIYELIYNKRAGSKSLSAAKRAN